MEKRKWKESEISYLRDSVGTVKISTIAKNLKRSETAVILKMKRLGLSNTKEAVGSLTMHQLAVLVNVDPTVVKLWIKNHGLPYKKRATRTSRKFYFIDQVDFWDWAEMNKERIDFAKITKNSIVPEPEWVDEERRKKRTINYRNWTTGEVKLLLHLHTSGDNFRSISKHLNRSVVSVKRKYQRTIGER